jgi:hypothetical protein
MSALDKAEHMRGGLIVPLEDIKAALANDC